MSKLKLPTVSNIEVREITYNVSGIYKKYENEIKALLPKKKRQIISFVIKNTNAKIANGIRRTLIEEMLIKILDVEIEDIDTDEEYLIRDEFRDRINLIPIDQSINVDSTFTIDMVNTDTNAPWSRVYSEDIHGAPCDGNFSIAELRPGKHLKVTDIYVSEGYGYENAKFSPVSGIRYRPVDYVDVNIVNANGFFNRAMVHVSDVLPAAKAKKSGTNEINIHNLRILIIPDASYRDMISESYKKKIANYDVVITKKMETHSSMHTMPEMYFLEVETLGTVPAKQLIKQACQSIYDRLKVVRDDLKPYEKDHETEPGTVVHVEFTADLVKVNIKNETHTIGEIIAMNVFLLDPSVPLVNKKLIHPLERTVTININHAEPIKILIDACELGMNQIMAVAKAF